MSIDDHRHEFDEFYRRYRGHLPGHLRRDLGAASATVDEVVNWAFMVVWRQWARLRSSNPRAYLYKIADNAVRKLAKHGRPPEICMSFDEDTRVVPVSPDEVGGLADRLDDEELVKRLLDRLPPRQREVLTLRYLMGYSVNETAKAMEISAGAVKRSAFQALRKLMAATGQDNPEGSAKEVREQ